MHFTFQIKIVATVVYKVILHSATLYVVWSEYILKCTETKKFILQMDYEKSLTILIISLFSTQCSWESWKKTFIHLWLKLSFITVNFLVKFSHIIVYENLLKYSIHIFTIFINFCSKIADFIVASKFYKNEKFFANPKKIEIPTFTTTTSRKNRCASFCNIRNDFFLT